MKGAPKAAHRRLAVPLDEARAAPPVPRLVDLDVVASRPELADDAAKEVGVAVVPVRDERVEEEDELQVRAPAIAGLAWTDASV